MHIDGLQHDKVNLLKNMIFLVGIAVFVLGWVHLYEKEYIQFIVNMALSITFVYGYIQLRTDETKFNFVARLVLFFGVLAAFSLVITDHSSTIRFIWFTTTVYYMFYILDKREGWIWSSIVVSILITLFLYDKTILALESKEFFAWLFNILVILMIVNGYEKVKEKYIIQMLAVQEMLKDQVKEKTLELQSLNSTLKFQVEQEVEKNRQREQMMLQQTRMAQMGEMISMIAHQWRQPLTAISATSNTLILKNRSGKYDEEYFTNRLYKITDYAQHLSVTIDDFKDFFKVNKEKKSTTLQEITEESLNIIQTSLENKNITLVTDFRCEQKLNLHANELKQVVLNLLKNAEDVLLEKEIVNPRITIKTYVDDAEAVLSIQDNGGGVDDVYMEKIFKPYFTTKDGQKGTGLGLYMSKIIVEEHCDGQLSVENIDDGALFKIALKVEKCDIS